MVLDKHLKSMYIYIARKPVSSPNLHQSSSHTDNIKKSFEVKKGPGIAPRDQGEGGQTTFQSEVTNYQVLINYSFYL